MHIPACETQFLDILKFDDALAAANLPSEDYDITKYLWCSAYNQVS